MRAQAQIAGTRGSAHHTVANFTVIARFVPKKNLFSILEAFSLYVQQASGPRALHLCGSGPLEPQLREKAKELMIDSHVVFRGLVSQRRSVARWAIRSR